MQPKIITHILLCLFLSVSTSGKCHSSFQKCDSLTTHILSLKGTDRLEAYETTCQQLMAENKPEEEFRLLHAYCTEAARQRNEQHELQARTWRLYAFYNHNRPDSLYAYLPDDLRFMKEHEAWIPYYSCRSLKVERLQYDNKLQSALREAQAMYQEAMTRKSENGQGLAAYLIASCYQNMGQNEEALDFFYKAEKHLGGEKNVGQLHNLYGMMGQVLGALGRYDELLEMTTRWKALWDDYCRTEKAEPESLAAYYLPCYLLRADAYIGKKALPQAHEQLKYARNLSKGLHDIAQLLLLKEEALYEEACGNYDRALHYLDERYRLQEKMNNRLSMIETQEKRAALLSRLGEHEKATRIYEELLPAKDSLNRKELSAQLADLSTLYGVDIMKAEKKELKLWMLIGFGACIFLFLLLGFYAYFNRRLQAKNRVLSRYILEKEDIWEKEVLAGETPAEEGKSTEEGKPKAEGKTKTEETFKAETPPAGEMPQAEPLFNEAPLPPENQRPTSPSPAASEKTGEQLFYQLEVMMKEKKLFCSPNLTRKNLADLLGTNESYLAEAIRTCTGGKTVKEYITSHRLRYACHLLSTQRLLPVDATGDMSGFNSRSTYYRLFREEYGLTPAEFRKLAI